MKIIHKESLQSTNLFASELLDLGKISTPTIIVTNWQTAGKGYGKNSWESAPNANLLFSMVLFPRFLNVENIFGISIGVSLAICEFLEQYIDNVSIKWPNDIYWNNKKIAGILIENAFSNESLEHTIIGVGLNVNQEIFLSNPPNAVSLFQITAQKYNLNELLSVLSEKIVIKINHLATENFEKILNNYYKKMYRFNQNHFFKMQSEIFEAKIVGVNNWGNLILEKQNQEVQVFGFKEVEYII